MPGRHDPEYVSPQVLAAFDTQRAAIVNAAVARALAQTQDVVQHGDQAEHLLTVGLDFTIQALAVAMQVHSLELLDQQLQWANERLPHDGVSTQHLLSRFQILAEVVEATMPGPEAQVVNQFVQHLIMRQTELTLVGSE